MRLYLVRHARPDVASGICYGRSDIVVSPHEQRATVETIASQLPRTAPIFSSPLQRCASLARALSSRLLSAQVQLDQRLVELDFGKWEMQPWEKIARSEIDAWSNDVVDYRPGGGESVLQAATRINAFYVEVQAQKLSSVIVVCHAGTIRLLMAINQHSNTPDLRCAAMAAAKQVHTIGFGALTIIDCAA